MELNGSAEKVTVEEKKTSYHSTLDVLGEDPHLSFFRRQLGQAKIGHFSCLSIIEKDVRSFDIPMDDGWIGMVVKVSNTSSRTEGNVQSLLPREGWIRLTWYKEKPHWSAIHPATELWDVHTV